MAPEVILDCRGRPSADIYSFGVLLWWVKTAGFPMSVIMVLPCTKTCACALEILLEHTGAASATLLSFRAFFIERDRFRYEFFVTGHGVHSHVRAYLNRLSQNS